MWMIWIPVSDIISGAKNAIETITMQPLIRWCKWLLVTFFKVLSIRMDLSKFQWQGWCSTVECRVPRGNLGRGIIPVGCRIYLLSFACLKGVWLRFPAQFPQFLWNKPTSPAWYGHSNLYSETSNSLVRKK